MERVAGAELHRCAAKWIPRQRCLRIGGEAGSDRSSSCSIKAYADAALLAISPKLDELYGKTRAAESAGADGPAASVIAMRLGMERSSSSTRTAAVPGRHIHDHQMRLFMSIWKQGESVPVAAARAGISAVSAHRIEADPRLPSQRQVPRGRRFGRIR